MAIDYMTGEPKYESAGRAGAMGIALLAILITVDLFLAVSIPLFLFVGGSVIVVLFVYLIGRISFLEELAIQSKGYSWKASVVIVLPDRECMLLYKLFSTRLAPQKGMRIDEVLIGSIELTEDINACAHVECGLAKGEEWDNRKIARLGNNGWASPRTDEQAYVELQMKRYESIMRNPSTYSR